ncbi:MAG: hypothetical protein NTW87_14730 [Planctomycetota bacterium]|nr:hypothetical protein [Planctomycetota bacterium]
MVAPQPTDLTILVLSEDSAKDCHPTLKALLLHMLKLVDPASRPGRVAIEPVDDLHKPVVSANLWRSTNQKDRQRIVELVRYIGTTLATGKFVVFHADGDHVWSERKSAGIEGQFAKLIAEKVERVLREQAKPVMDGRMTASDGIKNLVLIVPFYSVEAWLYQNTKAAIALCHKHYRGKDAGQFAKWENNRGALDEVAKVKESVCLGAKHNAELAEDPFPAKAVYDVKKSFEAAVGRLTQCAPLVTALAKTRRGAGDSATTQT